MNEEATASKTSQNLIIIGLSMFGGKGQRGLDEKITRRFVKQRLCATSAVTERKRSTCRTRAWDEGPPLLHHWPVPEIGDGLCDYITSDERDMITRSQLPPRIKGGKSAAGGTSRGR